MLCMSIAAVWPVWTKTQFEHVTLLDIFIGMLIHTILLSTLTIQSEKPTNWHPRLVILMKKPTRISLHTQTSEPMPANCLPETSPVSMASHLVHRIHGGSGGNSGGSAGGIRVGLDHGIRGGGKGGARVETTLEVEA